MSTRPSQPDMPNQPAAEPVLEVDLQGDHRWLIEALGGTAVELGRGMNQINPLDPYDTGVRP